MSEYFHDLMPPATTSSARLTQAQRRDATRAALLDATIESLIDNGYAGTSTRGVAERAGVSQGAQQHYYPTKADLIDAAISRLIQQLAAHFTALPGAATELERAEGLLDGLWALHNLPVGRAVFELFNAARTDPEIAARVATVHNHAIAAVQAVAAAHLPELAATAGFRDWLLIAVATLRGIVVIAAIPGTEPGYADWPTVRAHLMRSLSSLGSLGSR